MPPRTFNITDVLRRLRLVRGPAELYQQFNDYRLTVGVTRIPLSPLLSQGRFAVKLAIIQADLTNIGVINVGGPNVSATIGTELTAGLAVLWSASTEAMFQQKQLMGALGGGLVPWMTRVEEMDQARAGLRMPKILIDLNTHYCIASVANQVLRIQYTMDVEVP